MRKSKEQRINEYGRLPHPLKSMVKILAVQALEFRQKELLACLKKLNIKDENNKAFTSQSVQLAIKTLAGLGLISKRPSGIACADEIRISVVKDAVTGLEFKSLAKTVLSIRPFAEGLTGYGIYDDRDFYRAFQLAVFNNQAQCEVGDAYGIGWHHSPELMLETPPFLTYFNQPFSSDLLGVPDKKTRAKILVYTLVESDRGLYPSQELIDYCKQFFLGQPGFIQEKVKLMEYLLFRGDLEGHGRLLGQIEDASPIDHAAHLGWRLLLCNETRAALVSFNESLALIKKKTRKRKIFLDGLPGLFFLFALLKTKENANLRIALTHIDAALRKETLHSPLFRGMVHVFQDSLGQAVSALDITRLAQEEFTHFSILSFFKILILTWLDKDQAKVRADELNLIRYKAKRSGHQWLEAECRCLLVELGIRKQNRERAEKIHNRQGTVSLVPIVAQVPKWEKTLNALINIGRATVDESDQADQTPSQRIIWLLEYDKFSRTCEILPRLQKLTKKKGWTKGRAVAMKNLYKNYRTMEGLSDQDREICSTIEENSYRSGYYGYGYYSNTEYEFDKNAALPALVGHPHIFLEGELTTPVELVESEPEVRLKKGKNEIRLKMDPMPGPGEKGNVLIRESPARFKLVSFTENHETIAALIGKKGLKLPPKAESAATKAMAALTSLVQVNSDLALDGDKDAKKVGADPIPHVHIMPWQDGVSLQFWVRPFRDGGAYLKPGRGGVHVFSRVDGENLRAERDLGLEKTLVDELIRLCPSLDHIESGEDQWQTGDPEQSLELLLELRNAGDKAILEWPKGERFKVSQEAVSDHFSLGIKRDREWFKATGSLMVDDENSLDLKVLLASLEDATGRFLPLGDGEFLALTRSLKERLEELKSYSTPHGKGVRITPLAGPAIQDFTQTIGSLKTDKAWKAHCKKFESRIDPQIPGTLRAELRDYQKTGFNWLAQLAHWQVGACLADDMGLGKTLQALAVLLTCAHKGPSLVVAPLSVAANWQEESLRFAPTLVPKVFGPGDRQAFLSDLGPFDLVVTSYGLLQIEADKLAGVDWQTVVLDEAQAIKNMKSKRSKAAMALRAEFRLITTGTPVENHLDELWTLFNFLNPGLLGTFTRFRENFALPIERDKDKAASRRLRKLISPFILRRLKVDVLKELPEKTQVTLHVEMSPEEAMVYEAHRLKALENIESSDTDHPGGKHLKILAELTRLRQLCCNPSLVLPDAHIKSSKLKVFSDTVDELLENRHKALVFSQFVGHLKILSQFLESRGITYQYLDGSTPAKERQRRINEFQGGQGDLFMISLKAGGSGLNLTAADYVIHMDPWWNPAVEDQASDRAHRIGQVRPVTVYRLVVKDTIEERIMALHEEKRDLARNLLTGSDMAGKISADELLKLLKG